MVASIKPPTMIEQTEEWVLECAVNSYGHEELRKKVHRQNRHKIAQLYYEYDIATSLHNQTILQPKHIVQTEDEVTMIYQDAASYVSLAQYIANPMNTFHFLRMAIKITNCLIDIHQANYIYRNVHPKSFLIDPIKQHIKIYNLEYAMKETSYAYSFEITQNVPLHRAAYIAPEETGRVNSDIDFRTDLYSIGVLFYYMIAGKTPYDDTNANYIGEILTKPIPKFKELGIKVPTIIEKIIRKLLSKNKEERYQSAIGLKEDLSLCWYRLTNDLPLVDFTLGSQDHIAQLELNVEIPTRQRFVRSLLRQTMHIQQRQVHIINGAQGTGKSYVLSMLEQALVLDHRFLLHFANSTRHTNMKMPIFLLVLREQLQRALCADEQQQRQWRQRLQQTFFMPSSVFHYFPELHHFIDEPVVSDELPLLENQQLFAILVKLIKVFYDDKLPLLLIDNWEDLDDNTQQFIRFFWNIHPESLVFITTTHDAELPQWMQSYTKVTHKLSALTRTELAEWLYTSIQTTEPIFEEVTQFLFDVTQGNPLFVQEFFMLICEQQILTYDHYQQTWSFDLQAIQQQMTIPSFQALIEQRLQQISDEERLMLKYAACIGRQFQLEQLLQIVPYDKEHALQLFNHLLEKRFLVASHVDMTLIQTYMRLNMLDELHIPAVFLCEDIFEVVNRLLSEQEVVMAHYTIYRQLQQKPIHSDDTKRLLIHHAAFCTACLSEQQIKQYIRLNYEMGHYILHSGLFRESLPFLSTTYRYLTDADWHENYELALHASVMYANALYLNNYEQAEAIFNQALSHCTHDLDRLFVHNEKILFHMMHHANNSNQQQLSHVVAEAQHALKLVGIHMDMHVSKYQVAKEYMALKWALQKKPAYQLLHLPNIEDEKIEKVLQILLNVSGAALIVDENLYAWIVIRAIRLIMKHGNVSFASIFYGNFANILVTTLADFQQAYRFGQLSIKHVEQHDNHLCKTNVYLNFAITINNWRKPYDTSIYYLEKAQKHHLNSYLHHLFNAMGAAYMLNFMLAKGEALTKIKEVYKEQQQYITKTTNELPKLYTDELMQWIAVLQQQQFDEPWHFDVPVKSRASFWNNHLTLRLQMSYLLLDQEKAWALIEQIEANEKHTILTTDRVQFYFYKGLWLCRRLEQLEKRRTCALTLRSLRQCIRRLKEYARHSAQNFEHMSVLLEAQYYRFTAKRYKASLYYDRAIQLAKMTYNLRDKAIITLNTALFYESLDESYKAKSYMERALQLMQAWHAPHIVQLWGDHYYYLHRREFMPEQKEHSSALNVQPIVTMYQLISEEQNRDLFLQKALHELMQQVDAEHIYFFSMQQGEPQLLASESTSYGQLNTASMQQAMLATVAKVCQSQEILLANYGLTSPKSMMCLPIRNNGKLVAILYCTNDQVRALFTQEKVDILTILATQMVVALENMEHRTMLEQEVRERTVEISNVNEQLQRMNERLQQNEEERKYFIQHISHDLRSPITSVLGYVEALASGIVKSEEQQQKYLERSKTRLLSLNRLIQDLFDMALLEGGRIEYQKEDITSQQLFTLLDNSIQNELEHETLHYMRTYDGANVVLHVDVERINQVIINLASNIRKYANQGTVQFSCCASEDKIALTLKDEGQGIPKKDIPFIFDMHYSASNNYKEESYGIGLSICKQIIEHHAGSIKIESDEGRGTAIYVELPIAINTNTIHYT